MKLDDFASLKAFSVNIDDNHVVEICPQPSRLYQQHEITTSGLNFLPLLMRLTVKVWPA